jgi:hypothetical protein
MSQLPDISRRQALALAILALEETAQQHTRGEDPREWYAARRLIKHMLDNERRQCVFSGETRVE